MRNITSIILHCSDSNRSYHDDIKVIRKWHLKRGFNDVGYHFFIQNNGKIQEGRKVSVIGAHAKGFNSTSIGICLHGKDRFSVHQKRSLFELTDLLQDVYNIDDENICCHYELNREKTCPNFTKNEFNQGFSKWKKKQ